MPSILNTGLSGLLNFQRALATTSHNVANSNTPGFSRQRTELEPQLGQGFANGYIGRGVQVRTVERVRDDFVETRLRNAISDDGRTRLYAELTGQLDNLLASEQTGLGPAMSSFFAGVQDLASDPTSVTSRQFLLAEADTLVDRFHFMDAEIEGLRREMNTRLEVLVSDVNALADDIARINRDIATAAGHAAGAPPNDLLDLRDQRINELAELVGVRTVAQENGALNVFTTSGQSLVVDATAQRWQVVADPADPLALQVADQQGGVISDKLSGGELGGLLDFRRESFATARNELGRIAVVLADTFNAQHREGMDANGALGQDFFNLPAATVVAHTGNSGSAAVSVTITDSARLSASDYQLSYDGAAYTLTRASDGASVSGAGPLLMDGVQVSIGAGAAAGDRFLVKPVARGAELVDVVLSDPDALAVAGPVRALSGVTNIGDVGAAQPDVVDVTDIALANEVRIVFNDPPTTFDLVDVTAASTLAAGVAYSPGMTVSANGWTTSLAGTPVAGDTVRMEFNTGGIGDNRNALALASLQTASLVGGRMSLEQGYSSFVGGAGIAARTASFNADARALLREDAQFARESVSGVNLDEEAVDLTRYQQAYQAMARVIETANSLFDSVLAAVGR